MHRAQVNTEIAKATVTRGCASCLGTTRSPEGRAVTNRSPKGGIALEWDVLDHFTPVQALVSYQPIYFDVRDAETGLP